MVNKFVKGTPDWAKPYIIAASTKYNVPTEFLSAHIQTENGSWNPKALSPANKDQWGSKDRGLAQINNHWHPEITDAQANDPVFAINWMASTDSANFKKTGNWGAAWSLYNTGNPNDGFYNGYVSKVINTMKDAVSVGVDDVKNAINHIVTQHVDSQPVTTEQALASTRAMNNFKPYNLPEVKTNPNPPKVGLSDIIGSVQRLISNTNQQNPSVVGNLVTGQAWNQGIKDFGGDLTKPIPEQQFQDNNNEALQGYYQRQWQADQMAKNSPYANPGGTSGVPTPQAMAMQKGIQTLK